MRDDRPNWHEMDYHRAAYLDGRDRAEWEPRLNPDMPVPDRVGRYLPDVPSPRVLDVGCGPLTKFGKVWNGRRVEITAIDPLADEYNDILHRIGVIPPVAPVRLHGEEILETYGFDSFDMVHLENSLDHAVHPLFVLMQAHQVVRPGGVVYVYGTTDAGNINSWIGYHQWNIHPNGDDVEIETKDGAVHSLKKFFRSLEITTRPDPADQYGNFAFIVRRAA